MLVAELSGTFESIQILFGAENWRKWDKSWTKKDPEVP